MNYTGPKVRISRALGIAITPKAARIMERRGYPPGQHGPNPRRRRRINGYKAQLLEKQRLRAQYNIHERQMRNYFQRATQARGNTAGNLLALLETRLDALVLRSNFAPTIYASRQVVNHRHITVNGKIVDRPSFAVVPGDRIAVRRKSQRILSFREALRTRQAPAPEYLTVNENEMEAILERRPERDEVPIICDFARVIEFYSR